MCCRQFLEIRKKEGWLLGLSFLEQGKCKMKVPYSGMRGTIYLMYKQ
jgi:hypothetical protein